MRTFITGSVSRYIIPKKLEISSGYQTAAGQRIAYYSKQDGSPGEFHRLYIKLARNNLFGHVTTLRRIFFFRSGCAWQKCNDPV
jgi:hypothetical protein